MGKKAAKFKAMIYKLEKQKARALLNNKIKIKNKSSVVNKRYSPIIFLDQDLEENVISEHVTAAINNRTRENTALMLSEAMSSLWSIIRIETNTRTRVT
jgi:hypothetical protein